eukprot:10764593-Lingulodinium_polyedra.AAC.1
MFRKSGPRWWSGPPLEGLATLAVRLSSIPCQEGRSVPQGPAQPTEDYVAGSRLAMSLYVARTWSQRGERWTCLASSQASTSTHAGGQ